MIIPDEFVIQKFYQHAGYPKHVRSTNTYNGGCPICREGKSWKRKSRLYYIPKDNTVCCHNCGWFSNPTTWILEVEQITYKELVAQVESGDYEYGVPQDEPKYKPLVEDLPRDCINLFDKTQIEYYSKDRVVAQAIKTVVDRGLNTAVNKPKNLYVTTNDRTHKNRLIIPFYDKTGKCVFYQSRRLLDDGTPKYLSKTGSDKSLFNFDNVCSSADNVFITEGPIDAFFIKNSVAVAGIQQKSTYSLTTKQKQQLDSLFLTQRVWVLDNQRFDETSKLKSEVLLKQNECVFIWPEQLGTCKDINDVCVKFGVNLVSEDYLLKHTYCGLKGIVKLKGIR